jgi:hypothetical protein
MIHAVIELTAIVFSILRRALHLVDVEYEAGLHFLAMQFTRGAKVALCAAPAMIVSVVRVAKTGEAYAQRITFDSAPHPSP